MYSGAVPENVSRGPAGATTQASKDCILCHAVACQLLYLTAVTPPILIHKIICQHTGMLMHCWLQVQSKPLSNPPEPHCRLQINLQTLHCTPPEQH